MTVAVFYFDIVFASNWIYEMELIELISITTEFKKANNSFKFIQITA